MKIVLNNAVRLDNIIMDFLEVSRIESARLKFNFARINVNKVIESVIEEMRFFMPEKKVILEFNSNRLPQIEADPDRMSQVLRNLLNNAIKFTPLSGKIEISAKRFKDKILFSVKDNGIGISQKDQKCLFEPFYQVEGMYQHKSGGTGLGLAISKGIVESQKGKIWVVSELAWLELINDDKLRDFIEIYKKLKEEEKKVSNKISSIAKMHKKISLLTTIPGIGEFGASLIYAEIGDISRFPSMKHLHAYAGVAPGIYQSASKSREAYRREINKWLKWILLECASRVVLMQNKFQAYYFKIKQRKGWKTARRATARKMLSVVWHILKKEVIYCDNSKSFN